MNLTLKKKYNTNPCIFLCILLLSFLSPKLSLAQESSGSEYDEIIISVSVAGLGITDIPAAIKSDSIYLPVTDFFDYLKIKNVATLTSDSVSGFFINEAATYLIDQRNRRIEFQGKVYDINKDDIIRTETSLYLKTKYFGEIFGLECQFNYRALLINVTTKIELPVVRDARLELMHRNMSKLKGEVEVDTVIPRRYPFFHFGMMDWNVVSTQQVGKIIQDAATQELKQGVMTETRYSIGLGGVLAGGETDVILNYSKSLPFSERRQYYQWRFVDNNKTAVRQVALGRIAPVTTASIFAPIIGTQFTNASTRPRHTFGTYTISNVTEPGWLVELYVNGVLVAYKKADATGFYTFEVPLVYGTSAIRLKFYGPFGEERSHEQQVNIPFNFLPAGAFEYNVSGGLVDNDSSGLFSKILLNYGIVKRWTIGTGVEYLSSVSSGSTMPFINSSLRFGKNLFMSGEYTHTVRGKGTLTYRLPSSLQLELTYTKFKKGQKAIFTNTLEERKATVSLPIQGLDFSLFTLVNVTQTILATTQYYTAEWMLAGMFYHVGAHVSTFATYTGLGDPTVYSDVSLAFRLPGAIMLTPEAQYEYTHKQWISAKMMLEKRAFSRAFLNATFERNFRSNFSSVGIQLRYELPYAQVGTSARYGNKIASFLESANGGLMIDGKTRHIVASNVPVLSKGGLTIAPFLDLNCNGMRDDDEPKVSGLKCRVSVGKLQPESKDTLIRITDMESYANCFIELNRFSFDNIAWQIRKRSMKMVVEPNTFKLLEVPIAVVGEASGNVFLEKNGMQKGLGQVYVCFYKNDSLVARVLSEPDGYFSYIGLAPGSYLVKIDSAQLHKISMTSSPALPLNILKNRDGDLVEGLEFVLRPKAATNEKKKDAEDQDNSRDPAKR